MRKDWRPGVRGALYRRCVVASDWAYWRMAIRRCSSSERTTVRQKLRMSSILLGGTCVEPFSLLAGMGQAYRDGNGGNVENSFETPLRTPFVVDGPAV